MKKSLSRNIVFNIFHIAFSFVAPAIIIIVDLAVPGNAWQYKVSLVGIVLFVLVVIVCKRIFVRSFQTKMNELLEGLATATDENGKLEWKKKLKTHKTIMAVIDNLDAILPLLVLTFATSWAGAWLTKMSGTIGMICIAMIIGGAINVWKRVGGGDK